MNLADRIKLSCEKYADQQLIYNEEIITYAQLWDTAAKVRHALQDLGIKPGDRIAIQLPKCMEFLYVHLANLQLGSISIPLNPTYTQEEIAYFLADSGARIFITDSSNASFARPQSTAFPDLQYVITLDKNQGTNQNVISFQSLLNGKSSKAVYPANPEDTALIIYTSGTTGRSKGAMLSNENLLTNIESLHVIWGHSDQDVLLHVLPIFHVHGLLFAFHGALHAGMKIIIRSKFDPIDTCNCIHKYRCTIFMGVPTMYHRLLQVEKPRQDLGLNLTSMRLWISGSAPLAAAIFAQFRQTFGHPVLERYGMSETGINTSNPLYGVRKPGSVGLPLPGVSMMIVDLKDDEVQAGQIGEVWVKGKNVFQGYWQMPEKTNESFKSSWFKTGDLGYQDEDGYLFLIGRSKDLIISGGMNVYAKEIETVIETLSAVEEAAVIGIPDDDLGERVIAVVVEKSGQVINIADIAALCQARLAGYKRPKAIHVIELLPRNSMGKVMKNKLRGLYQDSLD